MLARAGKLEADLRPTLHFSGDFQEIRRYVSSGAGRDGARFKMISSNAKTFHRCFHGVPDDVRFDSRFHGGTLHRLPPARSRGIGSRVRSRRTIRCVGGDAG
jgi:hypothetical protein